MANLIVGQSGGPSGVINSSLAGVFVRAKERGFDKTDGKRAGKKETGNYKRKNQH